jgi:hypothetical protein
VRDLRSQHGVRRAQDTVYNYAIDYRVIGNTLSRDAGSATTYQGTAVDPPALPRLSALCATDRKSLPRCEVQLSPRRAGPSAGAEVARVRAGDCEMSTKTRRGGVRGV